VFQYSMLSIEYKQLCDFNIIIYYKFKITSLSLNHIIKSLFIFITFLLKCIYFMLWFSIAKNKTQWEKYLTYYDNINRKVNIDNLIINLIIMK